jgi:hypothetical protein
MNAIEFYNARHGKYSVQDEILRILINQGYIKNKTHIINLIGLFSVGRMLQISGPINRFDKFAFNFDGTPLPEDANTSDTFTDVALKTAEDLWAKAGDKKIALYWSGGIDSTVALTALIRTNSDWLNRMIIYASDYSINLEYPLFYETYLKTANVVLLKDLEFFNPELFSNDRIVVDGTCGDQIWGCNVMKDMGNLRKEPYANLFTSKIFNETVYTVKQHTINYIVEQAEKFPVPIRTVSDLYWMLTFTHKWDHVRLRMMASVKDFTKFHLLNSFFNNTYFQKWAMSNLDIKLGNTWNTYKQPAKDFIYEFTRDNEYRINKLQEGSMGRSIKSGHEKMDIFNLATTNGHTTYDEIDSAKNLLKACYINT